MPDTLTWRVVDPWFNFRATKYLVEHGFYGFWDWFDDRSYSTTQLLHQEPLTRLIYVSNHVRPESFVLTKHFVDRNMASFGPRHWRNPLPWSHGHKWCHLPRFAATVLAGGYSKHLCPPCTCLLRSHRSRILSPNVGNVHLPVSGAARSYFHGDCSRLYLAFGGRKLRQRGDCHLLVGFYLLPMDQIGQEWVGHVGRIDGSILWIYGICMGRLRIHYKSVTFACIRSHFDGTVWSETLCKLQYVVCLGHAG